MKITASVGSAPKTATLSDTVHSLKLTGQTAGEKQWLAALLVAIRKIIEREEIALHAERPRVLIATEVVQRPAIAPTPEGWGFPGLSRKAHYFRGRRSLCGAWAYAGSLVADDGQAGSQDCAKCRKILNSLRAKPQAKD